MTPRDRRPDNEQGPINWGIMPKKAPRAKTTATRAGGNGLLEVVRSGNNPAPAGSVASDASAVSATSAPGSADGAAGPRDAGGTALMTEEDMRSAAAQAIASGTAAAIDAAIAVDLTEVDDGDTGWSGSAPSTDSPAPVVGAGAADGDTDVDGSVPASAAQARANSPVTAASGQDEATIDGGVVKEDRGSRPVVRPTAVDGPSVPRAPTPTTRVFTVSQSRPGVGRASTPRAEAPPAAPDAAAAPDPEDDAGILAESSAWEAATNALHPEESTARGGGTDWGVGRGPAKGSGVRPHSPWPAVARRQRLAGVTFALVGLALATVSAMNLARNAEAGHLWIPPWLVAVLGGAGLVAAAGYLAWAGGTPLLREAERWRPGVLDAAAGLTTGTVKVNDPARLVARARGPLLPGASDRGDETAPTVGSAPKPVMGTSTIDQSPHAPAGVAGAVGGFMLAGAVVCALVALILGPGWLIATAALTLGGIVAIRLAGEWLGQV